MPTPHNIDQIAEIFIDESSQTRNRFLLLGGIIVPPGFHQPAKEAIAAVRAEDLPNGEMKWGKVSRSKAHVYRNKIDAFFQAPTFRRVHFHSIVVDTSQLNDRAFNEGNREIGFNKEVYQLASKFARLYPYNFHLYPDHRDTTQRPEDLRLMLNRGRRKAGDRRSWPFRRCHFRDSKKEPFLQLVDVLLGSLGYIVNDHCNAADASAHKRELSEYVMRQAGIKNPMQDTTISGKFTIWHRQLR